VKEGASRNVLRGIIQYDTLNEVNIRLSDGSKAFDYTGYTNIIFKVLKADGTAYIDSEGENVIATSPVDGIVTVNLAGQATTAAGLCQSVIEVYSGEDKMTTARFNYEVFENLDLDEAEVSESQYPVFQNLMADLSALETSIEAAEALRVAVEAARVEAEVARVVAEAARVEAEAARADEATGYVTQAKKHATDAATSASKAESMVKKAQAIVGEDYATTADLEIAKTECLPVGVVTQTMYSANAEEEDTKLLGIFDALPIRTATFVVSRHSTGFSPFGGGALFVTIYKAGEGYGTIDVRCYSSDGVSRGVAGMRDINNGVWGEWEFVNPPMLVGVEYRTTERYMGKPVYAKLFSFGALGATAEVRRAHGIENLNRTIFIGGDANGEPLATRRGISYVTVGDSDIVIKTSEDLSNITANVLLKYIKTTDT